MPEIILLILVFFGAPIVMMILTYRKIEGVLSKIKLIEARLDSLEQRNSAPETKSAQSEQVAVLNAPSLQIAATSRPEEPTVLTKVEPRVEPKVEPKLEAPKAPVQLLTPTPPKIVAPRRSQAEWEQLIGGRLLNRIGAIAIIFGIGFFLKYAFDNNWITEWMRVTIGGVVGLTLLALGERYIKKSFQIFAQGLMGAGVAILYLSVFASFNFYHLVPQSVAMGLMSVVTAITILLALRHDSFTVAVLGLLGGYMTPFLLTTGVNNEIGLFSYIALLAAGFVAVQIKRPDWWGLQILNYIGTYLVFLLWFQTYFRDVREDGALPTALFASLFWLLFFGQELWQARKLRENDRQLGDNFFGAFNGFCFYFALNATLFPLHQKLFALFALLTGLIYALGSLRVERGGKALANLQARFVLTALFFFSVASWLVFDGYVIVIAWAMLGVVSVYVGERWKLRYLSYGGLALLVIDVLQLLQTDPLDWFSKTPPMAIFNMNVLATVLLAGSMIAATWLLQPPEDARPETESAAERRRWFNITISLIHIVWVILILSLIPGEIFHAVHNSDMAADYADLLTAISVICYGAILLYIGLRKRIYVLTLLGIAIAGITAFIGSTSVAFTMWEAPVWFSKGFYFDVFTILFEFASLLGVAWLINNDQNGTKFPKWLAPTLQLLSLWVLFALFSGETLSYFNNLMEKAHEGTSLYLQLENEQQLALSIVWLIYAIGLMIVGLWKRRRAIRIISFILFAITILKIFLYDLSYLETLYRIFSFIGLGIILLLVSYLYQRYKGIIFGGETKVAQLPIIHEQVS